MAGLLLAVVALVTALPATAQDESGESSDVLRIGFSAGCRAEDQHGACL